jgi:hypothetical protein
MRNEVFLAKHSLDFDVALLVLVVAILPLVLGDLRFFANPTSAIGFLLFAGAFFAILWVINHVTDQSF